MSIKVVIVIGVLLVALFIISVFLGACGNNNTGSTDLTTSTNSVQASVGSLMARPLATQKDSTGVTIWPEVRESSACVVKTTGCVIGPNQTHTLIVVKSDDPVRRVRRATFALLKTGSSSGSLVDAKFTPVGEDPSAGEVRSTGSLTPVPATTPSTELGRVHVNISQNGGRVSISCRPTTATCVVTLISE